MATFPLQDEPLVLPSGRIVRVYNLSFFTQGDDPTPLVRVEHNFRIQYGTAVGRVHAGERSAEAAEVVAYFLGEATAGSAMVAYAEICSTPAQAERLDPPEASFRFRRDHLGVWRLIDDDRALDHPPNEAVE
jgi:hypothetical protein